MDNPIKFDAHFGAEIRHVEIGQVQYTGEHWHVYINGFEVAIIFLRPDGYCYHDNDLNSEDAQALLDRILEHLNEPWEQINFYFFSPRSEAAKKMIRPLIS